MAEDMFSYLWLLIFTLTIMCYFETASASWKAMWEKPISVPVLSDRQLNTLYVILGLQAVIMLTQLILGFVADLPIKDVLLLVFVFDLLFPLPYAEPIMCFFSIRQTLKVKKQMKENGDKSLTSATCDDTDKTPWKRFLRIFVFIFAAATSILGAFAQFQHYDAKNTALTITLSYQFVLALAAALAYWLISSKK
jgi:hypothetical protein